jgi:hypothetical protein
MTIDLTGTGIESSLPAGAGRSNPTRYLPIAEHGLIGDLQTVALVGTNGTIDWYCSRRGVQPLH